MMMNNMITNPTMDALCTFNNTSVKVTTTTTTTSPTKKRKKRKRKSTSSSSTTTTITECNAPPNMFVCVTSDNRVKIYDVTTSRLCYQYAESNHLTITYTCVSFCPNGRWLGVGCDNGVILVYDLSSDQLKFRLVSHTQRVNDVYLSDDRLYSVSDDMNVIVWSLTDGSVVRRWQAGDSAVVKVAVCANRILTATTSVTQWDLSGGDTQKPKCVCKYGGHSGAISSLVFSGDGRFFVTGAGPRCGVETQSIHHGDRFLNVWDSESTGHCRSPVGSLQMDSPPIHLCVSPLQSKENDHAIVHVAGQSMNGVTHVWKWDYSVFGNGDASDKPMKSASQVVLPTPPDMKDAVYRVAFADSPRLVVARGSLVAPVFDSAVYLSDEMFRATVKLDKLLVDATTKSSSFAKKRKNGASQDVTVRGPVDMPSSRPLKQVKRLESGGGDDDDEGTLEDALAQLQKNKRTATSSGAANGNVLASSGGSSLQTVLSQALRSQDKSMLEFCLTHRKHDIIQKTVCRLPSSDVMSLLDVLVNMMRANPNRAQALVVWIQELLGQHLPFLLSQGSDVLAEKLTPLRSLINYRLATFKKLLQLQGRMELLLSQVRHTTLQVPTSTGSEALTKLVERDDRILVNSGDGRQGVDDDDDVEDIVMDTEE